MINTLSPPPSAAAAATANVDQTPLLFPSAGGMAGLVRGIVALPIRAATGLVRAPVGFILLLTGLGGQRRRSFELPVSGLDESKAQPIWFALRRAAITREVRSSSSALPPWSAGYAGSGLLPHNMLQRHRCTMLKQPAHCPHPCLPACAAHPQEAAIADRWLEALQVCQVAFVLLLRELDSVEANLSYWHRQEQRGRHFWSQLLRRVSKASCWVAGWLAGCEEQPPSACPANAATSPIAHRGARSVCCALQGPLHFLGQLAVALHIGRRAEGALAEPGEWRLDLRAYAGWLCRTKHKGHLLRGRGGKTAALCAHGWVTMLPTPHLPPTLPAHLPAPHNTHPSLLPRP